METAIEISIVCLLENFLLYELRDIESLFVDVIKRDTINEIIVFSEAKFFW